MPSISMVVEDTSPMLVYSANWRAGNSADSDADQYTLSSFAVSQVQGSTMSFKFNGTVVGVYGARRDNHGEYHVQVDNGTPLQLSGLSSTALFNQTLFIANVNDASHQVILTNADNQFVDIDYVSFETNIGEENEPLIVNTFQDSHASFLYSPSSSWVTPQMIGTFSGSSGHLTTDPSATVQFVFQVGDTVALYGPVGPNSTSSFSVKVDGASASVHSANQQFYRPQELLYFASNLGSGQHSLDIQLNNATSSGELAIDYANVYTTSSLGGSSQFIPVQSNNRSPLPAGIIAALSITSCVSFFAIIACIYLFLRQHRRLNRMRYFPDASEVTIEPHLRASPFMGQAATHQVPLPPPIPLPKPLPEVSSYHISQYCRVSNSTMESRRRAGEPDILSESRFPRAPPTEESAGPTHLTVAISEKQLREPQSLRLTYSSPPIYSPTDNRTED